MKICPSCGERLSNEARFCPVDGTALAQAMDDQTDDAATEQQFARTLYGAPAPGTMPEASSSDVSYDDLPASTSVDVVSSAKAPGADSAVAPSRDPAAPVASPARTGKKTKRSIKSPADLFPRPSTNIGLTIAAALGGAAVVGALALGVKLVRGTAEKPEAVVATAEPAPAPDAAPAATSDDPSARDTAKADAGAAADSAAGLSPTEEESAAPPAAPDAGSPKEPESPAGQVAVAGAPANNGDKKAPVATPPPTTPTQADPKQAEMYVRAGEEHLKRGSHAKAQAAFEQARAYDPSSAAALAGLGEVAFEQGEYARAIEHLRAAVRIDRNSRYLTLLGNSYFKSRNYRQAIEQYKRAQKLDPENTAASEGLKAAQTKLRGG